MGGKLAEPRKQTTNDFFTDVANENGIQDSYWFGINDISEEGVFVYESNDEPITWTNWASGEPNNAGGHGQGDCVRLKEGKWYDLGCDSIRPYVCERFVQGMYLPDLPKSQLLEGSVQTDFFGLSLIMQNNVCFSL